MTKRVDPRTVPKVLGNHNKRVQRTESRDPLDILQVKVFGETNTVNTGNGKRIIVADPSLHLKRLVGCSAFVSTVSSSGNIVVQIRNATAAVDVLSTRITIEAGAFVSYTAASQPVIDIPNAMFETGDLIAIDVDQDGTDARGLGVVLVFGI